MRAADEQACGLLLDEALARGGEYADLFFEHRIATTGVRRDGAISSASRSATSGLGIRVLSGGETAFSHTEDLSWESLRGCARRASRIAEWRRPSVRLPMRSFASTSPPRTSDVSLQGWRDVLCRATSAAAAQSLEIVSVEASFVDERREITVATSLGQIAFESRPLTRLVVRAVAERRGRRCSSACAVGGRSLEAMLLERSPEDVGREASERALRALEAREGPVGELPVVLAAGDGGVLLHEAVGHGLEADFIRGRTSSYAGRLGSSVASPLVTLVDDATLGNSRDATLVDDEGVGSQRTLLIDRGELVGTMHDRRSAQHFGVRPTGNGRRESYATLPLPRMTNTVLLAGHDDPADLVQRVRRGVFVRRFGAGQVDVASGNFVFNLAESHLIEDGRITAPLRDVTLVGNGPDVMTRITGVGHDLAVSHELWTCGKEGQTVPVAVGCPTLLIDRVTVGSARA
jgi:TldD protein